MIWLGIRETRGEMGGKREAVWIPLHGRNAVLAFSSCLPNVPRCGDEPYDSPSSPSVCLFPSFFCCLPVHRVKSRINVVFGVYGALSSSLTVSVSVKLFAVVGRHREADPSINRGTSRDHGETNLRTPLRIPFPSPVSPTARALTSLPCIVRRQLTPSSLSFAHPLPLPSECSNLPACLEFRIGVKLARNAV